MTFDKEKFLKTINSIPHWVKTSEDLMTFCTHIQYRLLQCQAISSWMSRELNLNDDQIHELNKIHVEYDNAYSEQPPMKRKEING